MVAKDADCSSSVDKDVVVTCLIEGDFGVAMKYCGTEAVT